MYVLFSIAQRTGLDLRNRYAKKGGFSAVVIKLRLPDGRIYGQDGTLIMCRRQSAKTPIRSLCEG